MSSVWDEWKTLRIKFLREAKSLDGHYQRSTIARVLFSTVATVSSAGAVGCGIAAPFTMGATLGPAAVFSGVASTAGVATGGTSFVEMIIENESMKELERLWRTFQISLQRFLDQIYYFDSGRDIFQGYKDNIEMRNIIKQEATALLNVGTSISQGKAAVVFSKTATTTEKLVKALELPIVKMNGVILAVSVYDLVTASVELYKAKKCPAGDLLRGLVANVDRLLSNF